MYVFLSCVWMGGIKSMGRYHWLNVPITRGGWGGQAYLPTHLVEPRYQSDDDLNLYLCTQGVAVQKLHRIDCSPNQRSLQLANIKPAVSNLTNHLGSNPLPKGYRMEAIQLAGNPEAILVRVSMYDCFWVCLCKLSLPFYNLWVGGLIQGFVGC